MLSGPPTGVVAAMDKVMSSNFAGTGSWQGLRASCRQIAVNFRPSETKASIVVALHDPKVARGARNSDPHRGRGRCDEHPSAPNQRSDPGPWAMVALAPQASRRSASV